MTCVGLDAMHAATAQGGARPYEAVGTRPYDGDGRAHCGLRMDRGMKEA